MAIAASGANSLTDQFTMTTSLNKLCLQIASAAPYFKHGTAHLMLENGNWTSKALTLPCLC